MRFIKNEHRVSPQHRVALDLGEQDAIRHELHACLAARVVTEAHFAADFTAPGNAELFGDAFGDAHGCHATRLGAADHALEVGMLTHAATESFEAHLRKLRRFAGTRLTRQNDDLMPLNRRDDLFTAGRDGQIVRIADAEHAITSKGRAVPHVGAPVPAWRCLWRGRGAAARSRWHRARPRGQRGGR